MSTSLKDLSTMYCERSQGTIGTIGTSWMF